MGTRKPNHADAELVLKLYELRREEVMRASRLTIVKWTPQSFDDVRAIMNFEHPDNAAWRQVSSYFEYAFGFARHGIVPADFLAEYNGEGLLLYAKIAPFLAELRAATAPTAFGNTEWVVKKSKWAKNRVALFQKRLAAMRAPDADADAAKAAGAGANGKSKSKPRKPKKKGGRARSGKG